MSLVESESYFWVPNPSVSLHVEARDNAYNSPTLMPTINLQKVQKPNRRRELENPKVATDFFSFMRINKVDHRSCIKIWWTGIGQRPALISLMRARKISVLDKLYTHKK